MSHSLPIRAFGDGCAADGRVESGLRLLQWRPVEGSTAGTCWLVDVATLEHLGYVAYSVSRLCWIAYIAIDPKCGAVCHKRTSRLARAWLLAEVRALLPRCQ